MSANYKGIRWEITDKISMIALLKEADTQMIYQILSSVPRKSI